MTESAKVLVLGAASWNRQVYVKDLPQGHSATIFSAREGGKCRINRSWKVHGAFGVGM